MTWRVIGLAQKRRMMCRVSDFSRILVHWQLQRCFRRWVTVLAKAGLRVNSDEANEALIRRKNEMQKQTEDI